MIDEREELEKERKKERELKVLLLLLLLGMIPRTKARKKAFSLCLGAKTASIEGNRLFDSLWKFYQHEEKYVSSLKRKSALTPEIVSSAVSRIAGDEPKMGFDGKGKAEFVGDFLVGEMESIKTEPTGAFGFLERRIDYVNKTEELKKAVAKSDLLLISTHSLSSDRCFPDQGKIVSASLPAIDADLWTGRYTAKGDKVYSLKAMLSRVDSKGYHNFIISGFNCKHHLIPIADDREVYRATEAPEHHHGEARLREMERALRRLSDEWSMNFHRERSYMAESRRKWEDLFIKYKTKCYKLGVEPLRWRCL